MTTAPFVELRFNPTDLRPGDLPKFGEFLGSPADALEAALAVTRTAVIKQMKADLRGIGAPTHNQLLRIADLAWQAMFWRFRKISAPVIADAYLRAYRDADAGDVPTALIYELADKHAEKIGEYFHESSRQGLADGFNTLVNRRIPAKAAADMVLDAYGLTPRQMRAFTAASQFNTPVSDVLPRSIKAKARAYIDKAFTSRMRRLSDQEEHNIDEQAKQFAWMWLQDKGRLSPNAQKLWITAKDERVCPVCGPLHGQKVKVNERFRTKDGEFWSPGLHPNCRCVIRLLEHRFSKAATALADWDPREHPRDQVGRFSTKARTATIDVDREFSQIVGQPTAVARTRDPQLEALFNQVLTEGIHRQAVATPVAALAHPIAYTQQKVEVDRPKVETARPAAVVARPKAQTLTTALQAVAAPVGVPEVVSGTPLKKPRVVTHRTMYAVVEGEKFDASGSGRIQMDGIITTSNLAAAAEEAEKLTNRRINDEVDRIKEEKLDYWMDPVHHDLFQLTEEQLVEVVQWSASAAAYQHELSEEKWITPPDDPLHVHVADMHGDPIQDPHTGQQLSEEFSHASLAERLRVDTSKFNVRVIFVNEGYVGKTHADEISEDPAHDEAWRFEGRFRTKPSTISVTRTDDMGLPVVFHEVEPILERPGDD